jgi:L-fuculose-phosphate aldolase
MQQMTNQALRDAIIACALRINRGKSGNVSARIEGGFLITPTALAYETLQPEDIVEMTLECEARGTRKPSSEWRIHRDIYAARPEGGAIVHARSPFATTLSCLGRGIPAFHYMVPSPAATTFVAPRTQRSAPSSFRIMCLPQYKTARRA